MNNIAIRILIFIISSFFVTALLYYQIKIIHLQQIILFLVVLLVITLRTLKQSIGKKAVVNSLLLFIVTLFIQLLIAATGAIFSPFVILIHLYAIGLSLFFDFWTALFFLTIEVLVLFLNIKLDRNLFRLVSQDFGSVLLYFSSILIITPISKFISAQYHIKSDTLKSLFKELSTQQSIIEDIKDFVFTTDRNLLVLSSNESAQTIIDTSKTDNITNLLTLTDEKDRRLNKETLLSSISSLIQDRSETNLNKLNLTITGYALKLADKKTSPKVIIKVNPVLNQEGVVEKLIFLIRQIDEKEGHLTTNKLRETHQKYSALINLIKLDPIIFKLVTINLYLDILNNYETDILLAAQINLMVKPKVQIIDFFRLLDKVYNQYHEFAQRLNIGYELVLPEELQEEYKYKITDNTLPESVAPPSSLSAVSNLFLLQTLMEKTVYIINFIAHLNKVNLPPQKTPVVITELTLLEDNFKLTFQTIVGATFKGINLKTLDNLSFSSGLESYLIKSISDLLGTAFSVEYNQYNSKLIFTLKINKYFS